MMGRSWGGRSTRTEPVSAALFELVDDQFVISHSHAAALLPLLVGE